MIPTLRKIGDGIVYDRTEIGEPIAINGALIRPKQVQEGEVALLRELRDVRALKSC